MNKMPAWADVVLIPAINLFLALVVSGLVVLYIGENPFEIHSSCELQFLVKSRA